VPVAPCDMPDFLFMNTRTLTTTLIACAALVLTLPAVAHHSFAVYFNPEKTISVTGTVVEFRFMNPHGILTFETEDKQRWKGETNAPNMLMRRGWTKDSIKPGDKVTVEGHPARDGSNMLRVTRVTFPDGRELIGQRMGQPED
jgi:hypothetical protein